MTMPKVGTTSSRVRAGLRHDSASVRLRSALAAGSDPDPEFVETLVERCAVEPVFHVRDMLTWALTRHPAALTVPRVVAELRSPSPGAESGAAHAVQDRGPWRVAGDHPVAADRRRRRGGSDRLAHRGAAGTGG